MYAIQSTIKPGDTGPQVANLYTVLQFLIEKEVFAIVDPSELAILKDQLRSEQPSGYFKGAAVTLVQLFQSQSNLDNGLGGVVEDQTADLLNQQLKKYGGFSKPDSYVVEGRVVDDQGRGLSGLPVQLFEEDVTGPSPLGDPTMTSADGHYRFSFNPAEYAEGDFGELARPDTSLLDRAYYTMLPRLQSWQAPEKVLSGPDLWIGAGSRGKTFAVRTEILFNAGPHTVMPDLVVSRQVLYEGLSDLERVAGLVNPRLAPKDLRPESLTDTQIEFLSRDCEEPLALIRAYVISSQSTLRAEQLARDLGLPAPEGFAIALLALQFVLAADDGSSNLEKLLLLDDDTVRRSLADGISLHRVPAAVSDAIDALVQWLAELRAQNRLSNGAEGAGATPGQLFATLPDTLRLKGEPLVAVAKVLDFWRTDPDRFVTGIQEAGLAERQVHAVVRTLSLGDLTGAHPQLVGRLQIEEPGPEHSALHDLAALPRSDWRAHIEAVGLPPGMEQAPESVDNYVTTLMRGLELRAPTAFVMSRMADKRIPFEEKLIDPAQRFIVNNPDFRFGSDSVFVRFGKEGAIEGVDDDNAQPLLQELLRVERVARVAPNLEAAEHVLAAGYTSALAITQRRAEDFVAELKDQLAGGEAEAMRVHQSARAVSETAFALAMTTSHQFNRDDQIQILSANQAEPASTSQASTAVSASSAHNAAQRAQTANLEVLFGNQDTCACDPCSAMGSPAHYLAELLMLLDRSGRNAAQKTPLDILLERRPDIAEIELDCDNAGQVMPYVDLVLELLEAPLIENALLNVIPRSIGAVTFDTDLDTGIVPASLVGEFREKVGIDLGTDAKATKLYTQPPGRWLVKGGGWRLHIRYSTQAAYRFRIFPQSGRKAMPESWSFPTQMLDYAYAPLAVARYPWSLPFELAVEETDTWLRLLGASLSSVIDICAGPGGLSSPLAAGFALSITPAEFNILTQPGTAAVQPWRDWGYDDNQVSPGNWYLPLRTVSLLKPRAGISHSELLTLIQCRFIQSSPGIGNGARLKLTGAECDSDNMLLGDPQPGSAALQPAGLRRVHLFIRLWRRLGWSMLDLDRAVFAHAAPTTASSGIPPGTGSDEVFTSSFLVYLGNLVRLGQQTSLSAELAIALFKPLLDTEIYWRQEGSRAIAVPSTYDRLFSDPSVMRPRTPEFELEASRAALLRTPAAGMLPQLRLSDHTAAIAAATGCTAADVLELLPRGQASLPGSSVVEALELVGDAIDLPKTGPVVIECVVGILPAHHSLEVKFEVSSNTVTFAVAPAIHFQLGSQPVVLNNGSAQGWRVHRYNYNPPLDQRAKQLRVRARRSAGTEPIRLVARILTAPGLVVEDELTLANLSLVTRHLLLARGCKLDGQAYRTLLEVSGAMPLFSPAEAMKFIEQVRRLRGLGLTAASLDELLRERFSDAQARHLAESQTCQALEALRKELATDDIDLAIQPGQAEAGLRKALQEAGWHQRLIDLVLSDEVLQPVFQVQHQAKIDSELPESVQVELPEGMEYPEPGVLRWSHGLLGAADAFKTARDKLSELLQRFSDPALTRTVGRVMDFMGEVIDKEDKALVAAAYRLTLLAQSFELPTFHSPVAPSDIEAVRAIVVPGAWAEILWFDSGRKSLCLKGPITPSWRDELKRLSSLPAYLSAIDDLFSKANAHRELEATSILPPPDTRGSGAYRLLADVALGLEERSRVMLERLIPMLKVRRAKGRALTVLEPRLGVPTTVAKGLMERFRHLDGALERPLVGHGVAHGILLDPAFVRSVSTVDMTPDGFKLQYDALRRLFKLAGLAKASKLDADEVVWLVGGWPGMALQQIDAMPARELPGTSPAWTSWSAWTAIMSARVLAGGAGALTVFVQVLSESVSLADASRRLEHWAGIPTDELKALFSGLGIADLDTLHAPDRVQQVVACLDWLSKTGCDVATLIAWGTRAPALPGAARARQFARAKVGETAWPEASRQPLDTLRIKRRDALVAEAVHRLNLRDANDLFGRLLVDSEMGPCMQTTRIRLAMSSVQLFVQRNQLGLEQSTDQAGNPTAQHVSPAAIDGREWDWMQHHRMWEANIKVLLNSENYIDMSLRRDKTPPYRTVEADLMQGDVSASRATAALENYLNELEQVSRLQTVGMYRDTPRDAKGNPVWGRETLYFVGATQTQPKKHYSRQFVKYGFDRDQGRWTPWQVIDLDLQDAYYVTPTVFLGELWLFWIDFREVATPPDLQANSAKGSLPTKLWERTLRWSRLQRDKWSQPKSAPLSSVEALSANYGHHVIRLVPQAARSGKIGWGLLQRENNVAMLEVDPHQVRISPNQNLYVGFDSYPFLNVANANELSLYIDASASRIKVFRSARTYRIAISNQEAISGFGFRAPGIRTPAANPCHFTYDIGSGEVLAQPYWDYEFQMIITTAYTNFSVLEKPRLHFSPLHHAYVSEFSQTLRQEGLNAFFDISTQQLPASSWFSDLRPNEQVVPISNYPELGVDLSSNGSYSAYNTELFFSIPFAVASELSKQQRFREAREWFHFVFNPTTTQTTPARPQGARYWNFLPFQRDQGSASIQALVRKLADATDQSPEKLSFLNAIAQWRIDPFDPHVVARMRPVAYQKAVVIAYIKNLIAWGDQLFRRDTMESLNEASQFYILAAQLLGRPGEIIPPRTRPVVKAFTELRADISVTGTNGLSNPLVAAESVLPVGFSGNAASTANLPKTLYFCVPSNPVLNELRQTVQDRLFKMRNCMNIDGVVRQLALFEPPIDPAALVRARAAGIDVGTLMADVSSPPPIYRFSILAQKASEVCGEVKSLGAALLSAIEKGDGEAMARLRSEHELRVLANVRQMKELQSEEAAASIEALAPSLEGAQARLAYYVGLVSQVEDLAIPTGPAGPSIKSLAKAALGTVTSTLSVVQVVSGPVLAASTALLKQALTRATEAVDGIGSVDAPATVKVPMNVAEKRQLEEMQSARESQNKANDLRLVAQLFAKIPDFKLGASGIASPVVTAELGGSLLSSAANFLATIEDARAAEHSHRATLNSMMASYQRRAAEWTQQAKSALVEIEQITAQVKTATIRAAIAAQDLKNHDEQITNANEVDDFMRSKWSNQELYSWMSQQISSVYFRSYQLSYDLAKRAERAYRHELGIESTDFVRFGHWDGLKRGLLAGELLFHDIKRMEAAYLEANARELEITRSISLRQLDAAELMALRIDGQCSFDMPEWLFNIDYPDHYQRRIKSVSVSLPCVVGPYTGISGKLTMLSGKVRVSPTPGLGYADESNYRSSQIGVSSIAVSSAQGDTGLFEFNLRDERFLPFEGAGIVDSRWKFELPRHVHQFDYDTIVDLVLTVRYTAKSSTALRQEAESHLNTQLTANTAARLLIDVRRDFAAEWSRATSSVATVSASLTLEIERHHFPYVLARRASLGNSGHMVWIHDGQGQHWIVSPQNVTISVSGQNNDSWLVDVQLPSKPSKGDELVLGLRYSLA